MPRTCSITGAHVTTGNRIHRSGLAKKKGGVGRHVTKVVGRVFHPNLQKKRIWVSELGRYVTVRLSTRALRTIGKNGSYAVLKEAGLI
jgi:large subunit ribosomal protein L28